jgi:glycosyltransferase involved in cell wall biosynthesis
LSDDDIKKAKSKLFGKEDNKVTFFWNNRNARRKMSGSLIHWFNEFAEEVGPENVRLIMHTDPKDPHGQDLRKILNNIGALDGRIVLSTKKVQPHALATYYNIADCTINISDAEGFGLATLESLSCQTPIIVNMTGGLQEQVTDGEEWFGIGIEPASKAIIGSQTVPFIYEDRISKEDFIQALRDIYQLTPSQRKLLGMKGRQHVVKNYNFDNFRKKWIELIDSVVENHGSWDTRKGYQSWEIKEIK